MAWEERFRTNKTNASLIAKLTEDERVSPKLLTIIDPGDRISNLIDLA